MRVRFLAGSTEPSPVEDNKPAATSPYSALFRRSTVAVAVLAAIAVLATLAGCASPDQKQARPWKVEPMLDVRHGAPSSEAYYALGRYHDGSQAWAQAIVAYRKAVAADVRNVEAYNALGVAQARRHRLEDAEATLRKAIVIDPRSAHVRSNLGFVLLLAGRPSEAVGELKAALALDGENLTARANLREALARLEPSQADRESELTAVVSKPETTEMRATERAVPAPVIAAEVSAPSGNAVPADLRVIDRPTVPAFATGVAAALSPAPIPPVQFVPEKLSPSASVTANVQLELSNGNGIKGAAARLKQWLAAEGLPVHRLSNRRPYDQRQTVIQYRAGQQEAAVRVARTLRMAARLDDAPSTDLRSDVRVVLGQDWLRTAACLERNACERPAMVAATSAR